MVRTTLEVGRPSPPEVFVCFSIKTKGHCLSNGKMESVEYDPEDEIEKGISAVHGTYVPAEEPSTASQPDSCTAAKSEHSYSTIRRSLSRHAVNVAMGHNTVRVAVMDLANRAPTADEQAAMEQFDRGSAVSPALLKKHVVRAVGSTVEAASFVARTAVNPALGVDLEYRCHA